MEFVPFVYEKDKNLKTLKKISDKCGSRSAKSCFNYLRMIFYHKRDRIISEYIDGVAYYVACLLKDKIRLIEIAVSEEWQRKGIGKKIINRLKAFARANGITKITLRTSSDETSFMFYQKLGFYDVGMSKNDIEMECII